MKTFPLRKFTSAPHKKQHGVALMIVIFIFALVSILSVGMYNRQSLFVQKAGNVLANTQAYQYAVASEVYGRRLLKADWDEERDDPDFIDDSMLLQNSLIIPVEEAFLEAQVNDLQGKLNINDLVKVDAKTVNTVVKDRFTRLFSRLAIASIKVEALIDWMDTDQTPVSFDGAEDGEYLSLEPSYRNAGQPFQHLSELRLLPNITLEDYQKLLPHVNVLPQGFVNVNVNTATAEVLQSLTKTMTDQQAESLVEERDKEAWKTLANFKSDPVVSASNLVDENLGVTSDFFEIATKITLSDRVVRLISIVYRKFDDGVMTVISRDQGQKYLITKEKVAAP